MWENRVRLMAQTRARARIRQLLLERQLQQTLAQMPVHLMPPPQDVTPGIDLFQYSIFKAHFLRLTF